MLSPVLATDPFSDTVNFDELDLEYPEKLDELDLECQEKLDETDFPISAYEDTESTRGPLSIKLKLNDFVHEPHNGYMGFLKDSKIKMPFEKLHERPNVVHPPIYDLNNIPDEYYNSMSTIPGENCMMHVIEGKEYYMFARRSYTDVCFYIGDATFYVNSAVLRRASYVLGKLILETPMKDGVKSIEINDFNPKQLAMWLEICVFDKNPDYKSESVIKNIHYFVGLAYRYSTAWDMCEAVIHGLKHYSVAFVMELLRPVNRDLIHIVNDAPAREKIFITKRNAYGREKCSYPPWLICAVVVEKDKKIKEMKKTMKQSEKFIKQMEKKMREMKKKMRHVERGMIKLAENGRRAKKTKTMVVERI